MGEGHGSDSLAEATFAINYEDPSYQEAHRNLYRNTLLIPLKSVLPPGVSQEEFDKAIDELQTALGKDGVLTGHVLEEYIDPYELWEQEGERRMPSAAVCPTNIQEIQSVLLVCNKYGIPVWTFSRGKNLGYGGPAPRLNGSISLDLHKMNEIIEVNEKFAYAVVEPGVTFADLYEYCRDKKLKVWPSVPSLGWGSVVGNTVDRGTGFTPTATHFQHICGLEAILADGDIVRTGQFAIEQSPSAHLSKFQFGPSIDGLFLQSNLGIVTKLGIWLTPQPQAFMSCTFSVPRFEDVEPFVEVFGHLRQTGLLPNTVFCSNLVETLSMVAGTRQQIWPHELTIPDAALAELQRKHKLGYWTAKFGLYGSPAVVQSQYDEVRRFITHKAPELAEGLSGQLFAAEGHNLLDPTSVPAHLGGFFVGIPSLWSLPMVKYRLTEKAGGIGAHTDFSPVIPSDGKAVLEWCTTAKKVYAEHGFELFCDFFMHERHLIFVNMLVIDKSDPRQRKAADQIFRGLYVEARKRGYSKYRTHVNYMDLVADGFTFNNHAYRRFVEKIKDSLDPQGILSPGKQGIWPAKYRQFREEPYRL